MTAYYNEIDPYAAQWLRNLIEADHIAPGIVDERSIEDVYPSDLRGFTQCHFFAGIGVWSYSLRSAGWSDDRPVWTGSCPCQPFSSAGKRVGADDERHLWPAWHHLISQCAPRVLFGEQVASGGTEWLASARDDLEAEGYAVGCADIDAEACGSFQSRVRLFFVADRMCKRRKESRLPRQARSVLVGHPWHGRHSAHTCWTCRDGKTRGLEPGLLPVAPRSPGWVEQVRAYGNAINADAATTMIAAYMDSMTPGDYLPHEEGTT